MVVAWTLGVYGRHCRSRIAHPGPAYEVDGPAHPSQCLGPDVTKGSAHLRGGGKPTCAHSVDAKVVGKCPLQWE